MYNNMESTTDYLFPTPSFIEGMARIFDFADALQKFNYSEDEQEADYMAISNDWKMVGQDIRSAIQQYEKVTPLANVP